MDFILYGLGQGSGYILDQEINDNDLNKTEITILKEIIHPNDQTDLSGFFCRKLKYVGLKSGSINEMLFYIGSESNLFNTKHYYQSVFRIEADRIFEIFGQGSGRDFIYKNGQWK